MVHARTKIDGYKPPAHWEWIPRVQDVVKVPVFANGDIWSVEDWRRCREISGVDDIMLGRGLVSRPDLARQIAAARAGEEVVQMTWAELMPLMQDFWLQAKAQDDRAPSTGPAEAMAGHADRNYPEATELFTSCAVKPTRTDHVSRLLGLRVPRSRLKNFFK